MALLAIDIGNTEVALGVFQGEKLLDTWRLATDVHKTPDEYGVLLLNLLPRAGVSPEQIKGAILCCVVPPLVAPFQELCQRYLGVAPLVVGAGIKTGIRIATENPREVGADRVADALAGFRIYGGPIIIIDFGTAITFDAVSGEGELLGVAIAPGIGIAAEALFQRAAKLPGVELVRPKQAIGRNTVTAMQSGLIFGYVGLVEGIVVRIKQELGGAARVVATGGLAHVMAKETTIVEAVEPNLTLLGLRFIYEINRPSAVVPH
ncbi:MAG: type III pantothenate kinase [Chloroflexi bacterium]|nr:type III pantothenate kinase [Chloroflexota bacterium]